MNVPGLLLRSLGCLLVSNALSSLTDRDCRWLLALLVLEIDTRDRKPVLREDVRCFSVAQHGTSQKCSHCQRRQSKFKYGFHLYMRFPCKRICAHRCNPRGRQNPQEICDGAGSRSCIVRLPGGKETRFCATPNRPYLGSCLGRKLAEASRS
jgi:hypothetical protein